MSIYITKSNADIEFMYFYRATEWLQAECRKGGFASEHGGVKNQLHMQGFALCEAPGTAVGAESVRESIKREFPIPAWCGYKVSVKPFEGAQTPLFMLGYIQKDTGKPWFHLVVIGFL